MSEYLVHPKDEEEARQSDKEARVVGEKEKTCTWGLLFLCPPADRLEEPVGGGVPGWRVSL